MEVYFLCGNWKLFLFFRYHLYWNFCESILILGHLLSWCLQHSLICWLSCIRCINTGSNKSLEMIYVVGFKIFVVLLNHEIHENYKSTNNSTFAVCWSIKTKIQGFLPYPLFCIAIISWKNRWLNKKKKMYQFI
jgi:hypothetical protein